MLKSKMGDQIIKIAKVLSICYFHKVQICKCYYSYNHSIYKLSKLSIVADLTVQTAS